MSDPRRAPDAVISALAAACRAHPHQRVMQIVVNALGEDPFYVEDVDAASLLRRYAHPDPTEERDDGR